MEFIIPILHMKKMKGWKIHGFYTRSCNYKENKEIETKYFCKLKTQMTNIETKRGTGMKKN